MPDKVTDAWSSKQKSNPTGSWGARKAGASAAGSSNARDAWSNDSSNADETKPLGWSAASAKDVTPSSGWSSALSNFKKVSENWHYFCSGPISQSLDSLRKAGQVSMREMKAMAVDSMATTLLNSR